MTIKLEEYCSEEFRKGIQYKYFFPTTISESWVWNNQQINQLVEKAAIKLGELNSYARLVDERSGKIPAQFRYPTPGTYSHCDCTLSV